MIARANRCLEVNSSQSNGEREKENPAKITKSLLRQWGRLLCVCSETEGKCEKTVSLYWPIYSSICHSHSSDQGI